MEMVRSVVSKVMWVGRVTVFMVGLAVILALLFGVASMALGANGNPWILGRGNVATAITSLGGAAGVEGPMLRITNNDAAANDTALDLRVQAGEAPMRVNSTRRVANLNADKIDGKNSSALMPAQTYVVEHEEVIEPPVTGRSKAILCEEGDVPISGGFGSLDPQTQIISSRRIVLSGRDAWLVAVRTSESDTYTVQAVCADFPPTHE